ncbi:MAG: EamA family transporter [Methyloligellaceae bacterium]
MTRGTVESELRTIIVLDLTSSLPALLALLSSFLFAMANQIISVGQEKLDNRSGTLINITATTLMFWLLTPFYFRVDYFWSGAVLLFALAGLVQPALSVTLATEGIKKLGPTLSAGLAATTPLFAILLAILFLGEALTGPLAIGTAAVIIGIVISTTDRKRNIMHSWPLWALLLPLGAAFFRGSSITLVKAGLAEVPSPFFAVFITYTVSIVIVFSKFKIDGLKLPHPSGGHRWFALAGILNGAAILSMSFAVLLGKIVTVAPIGASTPLISMLLGLFIFKREMITWRIVLALALVIPGIIYIVLQSS